MYRLLTFIMMVIACTASGVTVLQSNWTGGLAYPASVTEWTSNFTESSNISWRAVEGQVCLSSALLVSPEESVLASDHPCSSLGYGDLDQDGDIDLVATSVVTDHMTIFWNNGSGVWDPEPIAGPFSGALWVDVCDLDGDGDLDLLEVTESLDGVVVWINSDGTGSQWDMYELDPDFIQGHSIFGKDIDGDGLVDITAASCYSDEVKIWYNNGGLPDTWVYENASTTAPGVRTAIPADLDGDGSMEIVGAVFDTGKMVWWEKSGSNWIEHTISDDFPGAHHAFCSDVDFDGDMDVLGASFSSAKITWWRNDGGYPIVWHRTDITSSLPGALISWAGDIDGDGDIDVASTGWTGDRVLWYENLDGVGNSWQNHYVATGFNGAWPVITADTDGDGCLELVTGADVLSSPGTSHGISIYDVCEFELQGSLVSNILDTACDPQWASSEWDCVTPSGTSVCVSWKTSDDAGDMGDWKYPMYEPGLMSGLLDRFVQYRLEFTSGDPSVSPLLTEISLNWCPTGIEEDDQQSLTIRSANGSPCSASSVCIEVGFPEGIQKISVILLDMSGRIVSLGQVSSSDPYFQAGDQKPGIYHAVAETQGIRASERVVAIN